MRRAELSPLPGWQVSQEDSRHDRQEHAFQWVGCLVLHMGKLPAMSVAAESVDVLLVACTRDIDGMYWRG